MKRLAVFAAAALTSLSAFAQQPLPSCVTNVIITLTDTNAYFDGTGSSVTNLNGNTGTVVIDRNACSTNQVQIGSLFVECDAQRFCQNNENIWNCPPSNVIPIYMPPSCNGTTITVSPSGECCGMQVTPSNPIACNPQDPSGPQP